MSCPLRSTRLAAFIALLALAGPISAMFARAEAAPASATFHVSERGMDSWSGNLPAPNEAGTDGPFATPARPRDAARRLRTSDKPPGRGDIVILVHAGRYELVEPLVFALKDSGTAESRTIFAAAPGDEGRAVLSGGRLVSGWRGTPGVRGEWVADFPGLKDGWRFRHVSLDGQWRGRPRLPEGEEGDRRSTACDRRSSENRNMASDLNEERIPRCSSHARNSPPSLALMATGPVAPRQSPGQAGPSPLSTDRSDTVGLTPETERVHSYVTTPLSGEFRWRQIPWLLDLAEGCGVPGPRTARCCTSPRATSPWGAAEVRVRAVHHGTEDEALKGQACSGEVRLLGGVGRHDVRTGDILSLTLVWEGFLRN